MIRLLEKHSLTVRNQFRAEKFQLNLSERQSTATITIGPEAPTIRVGDWIQDDKEPGAGIVWRVRSIQTDYTNDTRTLQCDHLIMTLKDYILGEVKPGDMNTANPKSAVCTAKQAISYILKKSDDWQIGTYAPETSTAPYNFNGDDLYSACETVTNSLISAWWTFDFSTYPFRLNINLINTTAGCEMRLSRNITTMRQTVDMSRMFTRFYPVGKNNLRLAGKGYMQKNTGKYGVICKTETDASKDTQRKLEDWANERLATHAEPAVTVNISGLDLSAATGEDLDRLTLGRVCRVPLPEYGTTITERITQIQWSDKIADTESVTITLANRQEDVATILNEMAKAAGGGGRTKAKEDEEDNAWFIDTTDKVGMVAQAVAGPGAEKEWSRVAECYADGEGIHSYVKTVGDKVNDHEVQLNVLDDKVELVVYNDATGNHIRAGQICLAINNDGSSDAVIEATKIHLLGDTIADTITANYISTKIASLSLLSTRSISSSGSGATISCSGYIYGDDFVIGSSTGGANNKYVHNAIEELQITSSGNTYKLQKKDFSDSDWVDVGTFSRAVASWDLGWSSGTFTAKAEPQNQSVTTTLEQGASSWDGRTVTIYINARNSDHPSTSVVTGKSVSATYTLAKSGITCSRGTVQSTQPTTDGTVTRITANGWYVLTVNAAGTEKTYKVQISV